MRLIEGIVFVAIASGAHLGLWAALPEDSGAQSEGNSGHAEVSLVTATPEINSLVGTWTKAPSAQQAIDQSAPAPQIASVALPDTVPPASVSIALPGALPVPQGDVQLPQIATPADPAPDVALTAPSLNSTPPVDQHAHAPSTTVPDRPAPAPAQPALQLAAMPPDLPQIDTAAAGPTSKRPMLRPADLAPAETRANSGQTHSTAQNGTTKPQRAKGNTKGSAQTKGTARANTQTQSTSANTKALRAQWGARIQAKVRRGFRGSIPGSARVIVRVAPSGKLKSVRIGKSSGNAAFDRAALAAVKRARRFARAPKGLTDASYAFGITLRIKG